jgi:hypothetical protein
VKASDTALLNWIVDKDNEEELVNDVRFRLDKSSGYLNEGQLSFFNKIAVNISRVNGNLHYLDGPGGTGKTFLLNMILDLARVRGCPAVVTALSGVAALLLRNGQTAHLAFHIPLDIWKNGKCAFDKDSGKFGHLLKARFLVWDKIDMIHKNTIKAVNCSLQALCDLSKPFGGKTVIFFRGFLPDPSCRQV